MACIPAKWSKPLKGSRTHIWTTWVDNSTNEIFTVHNQPFTLPWMRLASFLPAPREEWECFACNQPGSPPVSSRLAAFFAAFLPRSVHVWKRQTGASSCPNFCGRRLKMRNINVRNRPGSTYMSSGLNRWIMAQNAKPSRKEVDMSLMRTWL